MDIIWAPHRCGQCGFSSQKMIGLHEHLLEHSGSVGYFYAISCQTAFPKWKYDGSCVKLDVHTQTEEGVSIKNEITSDHPPEIKVEDDTIVKTELCELELDIDLRKDFELRPTTQKDISDLDLDFCDQNVSFYGTGSTDILGILFDHDYSKPIQSLPLLNWSNMQVEEVKVESENIPIKQNLGKQPERAQITQSKMCMAEKSWADIEPQSDINVQCDDTNNKEDLIPIEHKTATDIIIKEADQNDGIEFPVFTLNKLVDNKHNKLEPTKKKSNVHECMACGFNCATKSILMLHISKFCEKSKKEELDKKNTYKHTCTACSCSCATEDILKVHISKYCVKAKKVELNKKNTNVLQCTTCGYRCATEDILMVHISKYCVKSKKEELDKKNTNKYTCTTCSYSCSTAKILMVHISKYCVKSRSKICEMCGLNVANVHALSRHKKYCYQKTAIENENLIRTDGNDISKYCEKSKKAELNNKNTSKHTCIACSYSCATKAILMVHISKYCVKRRIQLCEICGIELPDIQTLSRHKTSCYEKTASDHLNGTDTNTISKFYRFKICEICGIKVPNKQGLTRHKQRCYRKKYKCYICDVAYKRPWMLGEHQRVHSGECPMVCDQCGKAFRTKKLLCRHQKYIHTEERNYTCDQCRKSFKAKYELIKHVRTHYNIVLYSCQFCEKKFSTSWNRKAHVRQHTGNKPYQCSICGKSFTHNVSRRTHQAKCLCFQGCDNT